MEANKSKLVAKWEDTKGAWHPIERHDAARMLRGNRRAGLRCFKKHDQIRIQGHGVCFLIARTGAAN
jgi:hypothetical protein